MSGVTGHRRQEEVPLHLALCEFELLNLCGNGDWDSWDSDETGIQRQQRIRQREDAIRFGHGGD